MKHTPGPWETSNDATPEWNTQITVYAEATGTRVATVFETPANARLIAAAPDMLEALSELVAEADDHPGWEGHKFSDSLGFQMARAAIAKAEGRTE